MPYSSALHLQDLCGLLHSLARKHTCGFFLTRERPCDCLPPFFFSPSYIDRLVGLTVRISIVPHSRVIWWNTKKTFHIPTVIYCEPYTPRHADSSYLYQEDWNETNPARKKRTMSTSCVSRHKTFCIYVALILAFWLRGPLYHYRRRHRVWKKGIYFHVKRQQDLFIYECIISLVYLLIHSCIYLSAPAPNDIIFRRGALMRVCWRVHSFSSSCVQALSFSPRRVQRETAVKSKRCLSLHFHHPPLLLSIVPSFLLES